MTDRHSGYVVTLEQDIREDDAASILNAIRMVKGVIAVTPVAGGIEQSIAVQRARYDIESRVLKALRED